MEPQFAYGVVGNEGIRRGYPLKGDIGSIGGLHRDIWGLWFGISVSKVGIRESASLKGFYRGYIPLFPTNHQ